MQIVSRGQNVELSDALTAHCEERAQRGLRPFSSRITRVQFVFVDLNRTRQGLGRACRVSVTLLGGGEVHYEGRAQDYYHAAGQALAGAARNVHRTLERRRGYVSVDTKTVVSLDAH
ncbi:MAG TPA: HPF/RaiA family ribosome-associated protein [Polyangiales bacterium]|nr:HPF/RaiA family ribosome-associated protein [Polyangiales bacterium]